MYGYKHSSHKPHLVRKCYSTTAGVHGHWTAAPSPHPASPQPQQRYLDGGGKQQGRQTALGGMVMRSQLSTHIVWHSTVGKSKMGEFVLLFEYTSLDPTILDFYPPWDEPRLGYGHFWGLACCGFLSPQVVLLIFSFSTLQQLFLPCSSKSKCSLHYLKLATLFA